MFQHTSDVNFTESLFTGLYIVVSKTGTVQDHEYYEILNFLNSELNVFNISELISDFISSRNFDWFRDQIKFSSKLRLGPTQILWNSEENFTGRDHILNTSKSRKTLKEASSLSCFSSSTIRIKYISENKYNELPNLFYKNRTIGSLIVDQQTDIFDLIDLFYSKKHIYNDRVPFNFLLTRSGLVARLVDEFDKYIVKKNLHKYRKYNAEDDEFIHDCFLFINVSSNTNSGSETVETLHEDDNNGTDDDVSINDVVYSTNPLHSALKEIVLSILISFLSQLVTHFSNELYSLESIKKFILKPNTHIHLSKPKRSSLKVNSVYNGVNVRIYGDLYLLLNKIELAINYYILSSYLYNVEGNDLEYCRTLFELSIVIYNHYLSKLAVEIPSKINMLSRPLINNESIDLDYGNYRTTGNITTYVTNESMSSSSDNQSPIRTLDNICVNVDLDVNNIKIKYDKCDKYSIEGVNRDVKEAPLNFVLFYLNKSFKQWIKTFDNSVEIELLFTFYVSLLFKIKSLFISKVINAFIIYSNKVFSKEQQCNILRYVINLLSKSNYKRKLLFYKYLLSELTNEGKKVDYEHREYRYKDLNYIIYNLILVVYNGLNHNSYTLLVDDLGFLKYEHWHQIKNTIIDSQIVKMVNRSVNKGANYGTDLSDLSDLSHKVELSKKVNKLILMKYINLFNYLVDIKYSIDSKMFDGIKSKFVDSTTQFIITHFVLLKSMESSYSAIGNINSTKNSEYKSVSKTPSIVNEDGDVNGTNISQGSDAANKLFGLFNKVKKKNSIVHFIGGFEELQIAHFPIVYSIKVNQHNYNYQYSNIKKTEHLYTSSRRSNHYYVVVKRSFRYFKIKLAYINHVIEPKCVIMNKRLRIKYRCEIKKCDTYYSSRKRYKAVSSSGGDAIDSSVDSNSHSGSNNFSTGAISIGDKKKYVEYFYDKVEKVVYVDKELSFELAIDNPFPVTLVLKNVKLMTIGVDFDNVCTQIEVPPLERNFKQNLKIVIREPGVLHIIGVSFLLFDKLQCYQLLFNGVDLLCDLLRKYESEDNFQDNLKSDTGLMELLKRSAVVELNAVNNHNKSRLSVHFTDFSNFYTDSGLNEYHSINSGRALSSSSRLVSKTSVNTSMYDSARSNLTRLSSSVGATNGFVPGVNRRTSIGSGSARRSSINTTTTSNNPSIINIDSIESDMISWLKVPKFGTGTLLKHLKLCTSYSCNYCNIFYSYYNSLSVYNGADSVSITGASVTTDSNNSTIKTEHEHMRNKGSVTDGINGDDCTVSSNKPDGRNATNYTVDSEDNITVDGLINGEIKLIYIRLKNENKNHLFANIKLTTLPYYTTESADHDVIDSYKNDVYVAKKRVIKNISIGGDYVEEKLKKNRLKHLKQQFYSRFIIILNEHCQLIRSNLTDCNDSNSCDSGNYHEIGVNKYNGHCSGVTVAPNETLYVPIIYKCNNVINDFNVILDYTIVSVPDGGTNTSATTSCNDNTVGTERGYVYRNVKIKVKRSLEINNIRFENVVHFNLNYFKVNLDEFAHLFKQSTLSSLKNYAPMFDHKCVKVFINVINRSGIKFNCMINKTNFVSDSNYTQRWSVRLRRMSYNKDIDLYEFAQMVLAHLQVKWTCDLNQIGVTNLYNLSDYLTYKNFPTSYYSSLMANCFNLANRWTYNNLSRHRISMFERVIMRNVNNLVMSKLTMQLSVSTKEGTGSTRDSFNTNVGTKFTVNVLVKNNGYEVINDYKVVVIPFNKECYTKISGIQYTGCLEQLATCAIIGLTSNGSGDNSNATVNSDGNDTGTDHTASMGNNYNREWDCYLKVASVEFVVNEPGTLCVNAAIISPEEKAVYWHYNPVTVTVT